MKAHYIRTTLEESNKVQKLYILDPPFMFDSVLALMPVEQVLVTAVDDGWMSRTSIIVANQAGEPTDVMLAIIQGEFDHEFALEVLEYQVTNLPPPSSRFMVQPARGLQ